MVISVPTIVRMAFSLQYITPIAGGFEKLEEFLKTVIVSHHKKLVNNYDFIILWETRPLRPNILSDGSTNNF